MDHLNSLLRWKAEASLLIEEWEKCIEVLKDKGVEIPLGVLHPTFVREWIEAHYDTP